MTALSVPNTSEALSSQPLRDLSSNEAIPLEAMPLWQATLKSLESALSPATLQLWLAPLTNPKLSDLNTPTPTLSVSTDSGFKRDWIIKHYADAITQTLAQHQPLYQWSLAIQVAPPTVDQPSLLAAAPEYSTSQPAQLSASAEAFRETDASHQTLHPSLTRLAYNSRHLNSKYTFAQLIGGPHNEFALAAAQLVSQQPGQRYNPLMITGGTGLGKTHVLHAIGHAILQNNPDASVVVVTAEQFTNELINAVNQKQWQPFRNRYRQADVLLIDDVQFLGGKERTQQEFFHTLNALTEAGKQVVMTCDRPPAELQGLDERLRSRFAMGLLVQVTLPDANHRLAIARTKAQQAKLSLSDELLSWVVEQSPQNIRQLEGALNRIAAYIELQGQLPSIQTLNAVAPVLAAENRNIPTPQQVLKAISQALNVDIDTITGPQRHKEATQARQLAMYALRQLTPASLSDIGNHVGGRNHSTVLHACSQAEKRIKQCTDTAQHFFNIQQQLIG